MSLSGKTIFVFGASGKLGAPVVAILLKAEARIVLFGRSTASLRSRFTECAVAVNEELEARCLAEAPDYFVDLAALNNDVRADLGEFREVNVERVKGLVTIARKFGVKRILTFSSFHALDPDLATPYAISKREARDWILREAKDICLILILPKVVQSSPNSVQGMIWRQLGALKPVIFEDDLQQEVIRPLEDMEGQSAEIVVSRSYGLRLYQFGSRLLDIGFAIAILLLLGLPMVFLAAAIRLDSSGPAIFAQRRVGKGEAGFTLLKFRTMAQGTKQAGTHEVSSASVTKLGGKLRSLKLDELPQALNILSGSLSVVGPRPCLPNQTELVGLRREHGIYAIRPGLTGLAQINDVDMSDPTKLVAWDRRYLLTRGLVMDIKIILQTFLGRGSGDRVGS